MLEYVRESLGLNRCGTPFTEEIAQNIIEVADIVHGYMLKKSGDQFTHVPVMYDKLNEEYVVCYSDASDMTDAAETNDATKICSVEKSLRNRVNSTLLCVICRRNTNSYEDIVKKLTQEVLLSYICKAK